MLAEMLRKPWMLPPAWIASLLYSHPALRGMQSMMMRPPQLGQRALQAMPTGAEQQGNVPTPPEKRQYGGPVEPGKPYMVGEGGPELLVPTQPGMIVPQQQPELDIQELQKRLDAMVPTDKEGAEGKDLLAMSNLYGPEWMLKYAMRLGKQSNLNFNVGRQTPFGTTFIHDELSDPARTLGVEYERRW